MGGSNGLLTTLITDFTLIFIKRYALFLKQLTFVTIVWLIMQGDFLVHFMDIAREELLKKPDEISVEKLQVFFTLHKYSVVV